MNDQINYFEQLETDDEKQLKINREKAIILADQISQYWKVNFDLRDYKHEVLLDHQQIQIKVTPKQILVTFNEISGFDYPFRYIEKEDGKPIEPYRAKVPSCYAGNWSSSFYDFDDEKLAELKQSDKKFVHATVTSDPFSGTSSKGKIGVMIVWDGALEKEKINFLNNCFKKSHFMNPRR